MDQVYLWVMLIAACVPGIWLISRFSVNDLFKMPENKLSKRALLVLLTGQTIAIVAVCAAAGIYFGPKIGIADQFLNGLSRGKADWNDLIRQLWIGAIAGIVCIFCWMACYYGFIRARIDRESVLIAEGLRQNLGLMTRITSGGITEEIIFRWGLLSFVMWLISLMESSQPIAFWTATIITGILFGLAHLPGNLQKGCKPSPMLISSAVLGNLWVTIVCGYLLWQYGLIAAIVVHILFHVIWYPLDRMAYNKLLGEQTPSIHIDHRSTHY
ncbi:CPBP family intramembrane glutamic endopeptidase [Paenibacillus herberti]|nr:CPBP family intramembrane glutamic endopeptidase [Paenibacillus herberti]